MSNRTRFLGDGGRIGRALFWSVLCLCRRAGCPRAPLAGATECERGGGVWDGAVSEGGKSGAVLRVGGQILIMKGKPKQGEELVIKSCELDHDIADSQCQLGVLYDRTKRPGEAVKHFQKVVDLDPRYASAWDYLALNLEPLGDLDRADAAYRRGLEVNHEGQQFDAFLDYNYGR